MLWFIRPIRWLAKGLLAAETPRQLALGFALGAVVGLVPKANLTAVLLAFIVCSCRVNVAMGLAGTFVFSWVALIVEPLTHRIGWALLSQPALSGMWTWLMDVPLVPWMRLNNTVVLGSLILGIVLIYPIYALTKPLFEKHQPRLSKFLLRHRVTQILLGADLAAR